ncbi:MAG TPA: zf-HC2 domain-containing protein [Candidatus Hydrogenedens sp.]|nr:zf-HC2 domain-containing protein [Candidatus Hydrogenedens sp.]HPP59674.1 zf-HC2 domain-containing protein [Candidatus Hydrogenedens sp.]
MIPDTHTTEKGLTTPIQTTHVKIPYDLCHELVHQYGLTLYEILWFEEGINDTQIFEKIHQILDLTCEQANSPTLLTPKIALFSNAQSVINELNDKRKTFCPQCGNDLVVSNNLIHTLKQLSSEQRFLYLLKVKENLSYRDLETITFHHRDEINSLLTEARELLRSLLLDKPPMPFQINDSLCEITYQYLSLYLDNEVNALHMLEVEKHLYECDTCLKILANHQHIQKQIEQLHILSKKEFLANFQLESTIRRKKLSDSLEKQRSIRISRRRRGFLSRIWRFLRGK